MNKYLKLILHNRFCTHNIIEKHGLPRNPGSKRISRTKRIKGNIPLSSPIQMRFYLLMNITNYGEIPFVDKSRYVLLTKPSQRPDTKVIYIQTGTYKTIHVPDELCQN